MLFLIKNNIAITLVIIVTLACSIKEEASAISLFMLYIAKADMTANWYGPMYIDVEGIIQAKARKLIINSTIEALTSQFNP